MELGQHEHDSGQGAMALFASLSREGGTSEQPARTKWRLKTVDLAGHGWCVGPVAWMVMNKGPGELEVVSCEFRWEDVLIADDDKIVWTTRGGRNARRTPFVLPPEEKAWFRFAGVINVPEGSEFPPPPWTGELPPGDDFSVRVGVMDEHGYRRKLKVIECPE